MHHVLAVVPKGNSEMVIPAVVSAVVHPRAARVVSARVAASDDARWVLRSNKLMGVASAYCHVLSETSSRGVSVWSPDGDRLACEAFHLVDEAFQSGVFTVRAGDGGDFRRLTTNPYPGGADLAADYSPDSDLIVFLRNRLDGSTNSALFVVDVEASVIRRITPWGKARNGGGWSPDGKWILFNDYRGRLWTVHADGTAMHRTKQEGNVPWGEGGNS